jgi:FkbM family methyltransferase
VIRNFMRRVALGLRQDSFIVANRGRISTHGVLDTQLFDALLSRLILDGTSPFVLQVGAHSGNTSHDMQEQLVRSGVPALLVEPQPDVFQKLSANYADVPNVQLANVALSTEAGTRDMHRIAAYANQFHKAGGVFGSSIASFDPEHPWQYYLRNSTPEGKNATRDQVLESVPVRCLSFKDLAREQGVDHVDVLAVDTEGFDFEVLKMVVGDAGFTPHLIKYEHKHLPRDLVDVHASWQFLIDRGYRLVSVRATGDTVAWKE